MLYMSYFSAVLVDLLQEPKALHLQIYCNVFMVLRRAIGVTSADQSCSMPEWPSYTVLCAMTYCVVTLIAIEQWPYTIFRHEWPIVLFKSEKRVDSFSTAGCGRRCKQQTTFLKFFWIACVSNTTRQWEERTQLYLNILIFFRVESSQDFIALRAWHIYSIFTWSNHCLYTCRRSTALRMFNQKYF